MNGFFKFGNPVITLVINGNNIEVLLDTGFNGFIMLPSNIIKNLKLKQIGISDYLTASGEERITGVFIATIQFFNEEIEIPVLSTDADFSLAGMELFHDCKIVIERHKNIVEVTKTN